MPLRSNRLYCINHPNTPLQQNDSFGAVTEFRRHGGSGVFDGTRGVPVSIHYCPECGYIELYAAQKSEGWDRREAAGATSLSAAIGFERAVLEAISSGVPPFIGARVVPNFRLQSSDARMADAYVEVGNSRYIVMIKAATSWHLVQDAASTARENVAIFDHVYGRRAEPTVPLLIVPANPWLPLAALGVTILQFDLSVGAFTRSESLSTVR